MPNTPYTDALKQYKTVRHRPASSSDISVDELLKNFHPDYDQNTRVTLETGPNQGEHCHHQLARLLQSSSRLTPRDLVNIKQKETDVLVIGGGGAGCAAALTAARTGARVLLATKLRLGDSNTVMAEGGIQASIEKNDTPQMHFDDTYQAGHSQGETALIKQMVLDGPDVIHWLIQQGMQFDTDKSGDLLTRRAGGSSADRVVYFQDYTGLEMMRVLREAVLNSQIDLQTYRPAIELLTNEQGHCAGAILTSVENNHYTRVKAHTVILATGGIGRLHLNGFPTSNHLGATGDGLVLAYRLGAKLRDLNSFQYHPSGLAYPHRFSGTLITEGVRSAGAQLLNAQGKRFIDELAARDIVAAAIIRECAEGRGIQANEKNKGVWLDTPALEQQTPGILQQRFPKLLALGKRSGINPAIFPCLIYPTLHYQNGGVVINAHGETTVPHLYCAGETSGGIHGKNRIMGNALLDIISFGRRAGQHAAERSIDQPPQKNVIADLINTLETHKLNKSQGPVLFPGYTGFNSIKK